MKITATAVALGDGIQLEELNDSNRASFQEVLAQTWRQDLWPAAIANDMFRWRYGDHSDGSTTWLAMEDGQCVAMLDSTVRPYLINGTRIQVREPADWYCLPKWRGSATGLRLMLRLKKYPEPIFVLSGSATSVELLSKLRGWSLLPKAASFVLPTKVRGLVANLVRRQHREHEYMARAIPNFLPLRLPRRIKPPAGRRPSVTVLNYGHQISLPLPDAPGLVQMFEQPQWEWLLRMPASVARPIAVEFFLDGELVGFSLSQIEHTVAGLDGRIMFLQLMDRSATDWVVSETTHMLSNEGAGFIRSCVSTPAKIAAMQRVGYIHIRDLTCHWWPGSKQTLPTSVDVGFLPMDSAIPFQTFSGRSQEIAQARRAGQMIGHSLHP